MNEKNFREFCMSFCNDWKQGLTKEKKREVDKTKIIDQLKILRNPNDPDSTGQPKSTGIGFIEVCDEDLAIYLIRNLNNFITNLKREKGLIVDFATEDHRKLLKRKQKSESLQMKLKVAKKERRKKEREQKGKKEEWEENLKKEKKEAAKKKEITEDVVMEEAKEEVPKKVVEKKPVEGTLDDPSLTIPDLEKMLIGCESRGKRSRIKRKLRKMKGEAPDENFRKANKKPVENGMVLPEQLLKRQKKEISEQKIIENSIKKEIKSNLKRKRKMKIKSEEEVDALLKSFEDRINAKLHKLENAGEEKVSKKHKRQKKSESDSEFDNVEISEM